MVGTQKLFAKEAPMSSYGRREKNSDGGRESIGNNVTGASGSIAKLTTLNRL